MALHGVFHLFRVTHQGAMCVWVPWWFPCTQDIVAIPKAVPHCGEFPSAALGLVL